MTEAEEAGSDRPLVVRARLVDDRGDSILGGRLSTKLLERGASAGSDEDGRVVLTVPRDAWGVSRFVTFVAEAPGRVQGIRSVERAFIAERDELSLGRIVLPPGGTLVGRVLDESGTPLPSATVRALPLQVRSEHQRAQLPWRLPSSVGIGWRLDTRGEGDGCFRIEGVPVGAVEVFATGPGHLIATSGALDVLGGGETRVPDMALVPAPDGARIAGIVRAEGGEPFVGADVRLLDPAEQVLLAEVRSDDSGRFEFLSEPMALHTVVAYDPMGMRPTRQRGVRSGQVSLELRFGEGGVLELAVRDERGPVAAFRVGILGLEHQGLGGSSGEGGRARVDLPDQPFLLEVSSREHAPASLGPFDPATAPERLDIVMERAGGIEGRVTADGQPVAGARVDAHAPPRGATTGWLAEDLVSFVEPRPESETTTDEEGRFFLPLPTGGRVQVHASAPGRGRVASGWLEFAPGARDQGLELALPVAGAIEGRLLVAPDASPEGTWIAAGNGDGHVELQQAGEDGEFRFDGLTPGSWQVRRVSAGRERSLVGDLRLESRRSDARVDYEAQVFSGRTTHFDLDFAHEGTCVLEGRLAFSGEPARGWLAGLGGRTVATLDQDGRFLLRGSEAGRRWVTFSEGNARLRVELDFLAGTRAWELNLSVGELRLENLPVVPEGAAGEGAREWFLESASPDPHLRWFILFDAEPDASAEISRVPAGHLRLHGRLPGTDLFEWPVRAELDLAPGERRTLRL